MSAAWQRFALVDAAQDAPALRDELVHQAASAGVPARSLFDGQPEQAEAAHAPWLLSVPRDARLPELTAWLDHRYRQGSAVSWLAAEADFDTLFAHLQAQLDVVLPDGALGLLRFWDARVFVRLPHVLALDQQIALMGPVLEWQVALDGQVSHLSRAALVEQVERHAMEGADADADA